MAGTRQDAPDLESMVKETSQDTQITLPPPSATRVMNKQARILLYNHPSILEVDANKLRSELGIYRFYRWNCPATTATHELCRNSVVKANRTKISSLLRDVLIATPEEHASLLESLAKFSHCRSHNKFRDATIEGWLPIIQASRPQIQASEHVRSGLCQNDRQCMAKDLKKPCENRGGQRVQNYSKTVDRIGAAVATSSNRDEPLSQSEEVHYLLRVLAYNALCQDHQGDAQALIEQWSSRISQILRAHLSRGTPSPPYGDDHGDHVPEALPTPTKSTKNRTPAASRTICASKEESGSSSQTVDAIDPAKYWPIKYDDSPFAIPNRCLRLSNRPSVSIAKITEKASSPFKEQIDRHEGYVYAYMVKGNEKLVKIGYTLRTTDKRHEEWQFDCNREVVPIYPLPVDMAKVRHPHQVEALCHFELAPRNVRINCTGCLVQHKEWFEIELSHAIAIIQKWSRWTATEPYVVTPLKAGEESCQPQKVLTWSLKEGHGADFDGIDQSMQGLSLEDKTESASLSALVMDAVAKSAYMVASAEVTV